MSLKDTVSGAIDSIRFWTENGRNGGKVILNIEIKNRDTDSRVPYMSNFDGKNGSNGC